MCKKAPMMAYELLWAHNKLKKKVEVSGKLVYFRVLYRIFPQGWEMALLSQRV